MCSVQSTVERSSVVPTPVRLAGSRSPINLYRRRKELCAPRVNKYGLEIITLNVTEAAPNGYAIGSSFALMRHTQNTLNKLTWP